MQQNEHLELGRINCLRIDRHTPHGVFLESLDEKDVLLPQAYVTDEMQDDTLLEVFLYTDSEDRLIATTLTPHAKLDEFAFFTVVDTTKFGAFMDWGLMKDLFVPRVFQKEPFKVGDKRFLRVVYDEMTHRLAGTEKFSKYLDKDPKKLKMHQAVKILLTSKTPLGYNCIVEDKYEGLIFHNEIFENVELGDIKTAFVKNIRKDGGIDLSLRKIGAKKSGTSSDVILDLLQANKGVMPYNYKSDAELIKDIFKMSKKDFKRSLTTLQEEGKIEVKDTGIYIKG
ncbi:DNA-binding protein [bacterium]|nr:DNA-binding protein [bacterium]MBU1993264.1 DNA-binding protein [bacterium]